MSCFTPTSPRHHSVLRRACPRKTDGTRHVSSHNPQPASQTCRLHARRQDDAPHLPCPRGSHPHRVGARRLGRQRVPKGKARHAIPAVFFSSLYSMCGTAARTRSSCCTWGVATCGACACAECALLQATGAHCNIHVWAHTRAHARVHNHIHNHVHAHACAHAHAHACTHARMHATRA